MSRAAGEVRDATASAVRGASCGADALDCGFASGCGASARPTFSFVMPVYNAASSVGASIESVLGQTAGDLELICVDDGSTDGTAEVLARYADRDARVRVIAQENAGPSAARNAGLDASCGSIICTIDADDALVPTCCERLLAVFKETGAEVVVFGARCEPEAAASERIRELLSPEAASYPSFDPDLLFRARAQPYAWRAAMARSLDEREHVRFPEGVRLGEDAAFLFALYPVARGVELIPDKLYRYRMVGESITHALDDPDARVRKLDEHLSAIQAILDGWEERGIRSVPPEQMIAWCLDLTLFDLVRAAPRDACARSSRLNGMLAHAYGTRWCDEPRRSAVRRAAHAVERAAAIADARHSVSAGGGVALSKIDLARFFLATRGLRACVQRFLR